MKATCFNIRACTQPTSFSYCSLLDSCWVTIDYTRLVVLLNPFSIENIQDLNCINFPAAKQTEGIEALATRSRSRGQWIFDTGAMDDMSGTYGQENRSASAMVTVVGRRKLKITGIGETSLNLSEGLIHIKRVLPVPELGNSSLLSWQKLAN